MNDRANIPLSEQYRMAARDWVEKDSAASMLEECKSAVLAQMMGRYGELAVNRAEMTVKGSEEWKDYITKMVRARESANLAKVKIEWLRMRFNEWTSEEANERVKARL